MRERLIALRERRAQLIARAASERNALAGWLARTDRWSHWAGMGVSLLGEIRRRPLWVAGAVALLFALNPKRFIRWTAKGWSLWQIARRAIVWSRRANSWSRRLAGATSTH